MSATASAPLIRWAVANFTPSDDESGDLHLVMMQGESVLAAVVDGVGHGPQAAVVARQAIAVLQQSSSEGIISLVHRCHEHLKGTRGAVMSLASFDGSKDEMTWLGVGNVEGLLVRASASPLPNREAVILRSGLIGYKLPPLAATVLPISRGDTLIFTTDGIRLEFLERVNPVDAPQTMADRICRSYAKGTDDALVLVVQYLGRT